MLRISVVFDSCRAPILKAEGKLMGPWVNELRDACLLPVEALTGLRLDLSGLTFVDAAGARLLGDLCRQGSHIIACSGYVKELLRAGGKMNSNDVPRQDSRRSLALEGQQVHCGQGGEADLLSRLRAGDEQAYELLVRQYSGRMLTVAHRFLGPSEDSADAVQDALCSAFQAINRFQGTATLATWLHRIVVNACLMKLRTRSRRRTLPIADLLPVFDEEGHHARPVASWCEAPCQRMERAETQDQVRGCIDLLPEDYRTVLLLRDIEELDTEETATMLGISVPAVKTRLHRARQALRTLLEPLFMAPGLG